MYSAGYHNFHVKLSLIIKRPTVALMPATAIDTCPDNHSVRAFHRSFTFYAQSISSQLHPSSLRAGWRQSREMGFPSNHSPLKWRLLAVSPTGQCTCFFPTLLEGERKQECPIRNVFNRKTQTLAQSSRSDGNRSKPLGSGWG